MVNDDCIFCKLANGVFETNTLYEDDDFRVIFDASPATKGHVLILPKEHAANVFELSEETASKVFVLAKKIATYESSWRRKNTDSFRACYCTF